MSEDATNNPSMISHLCQVCGVKTTYWCSRCHNVWYCSVEHMRYDWPSHRTYCQPYDGGQFSPSEQQSPQYPYTPTSMGASTTPVSPTSAASASGYASESGSYSNGPSTSPNQNSRSPVSPILPSSLNSTTTSFDAVLFPVNEDRPRIVRVPCHAQPQATGPTIWTPLPQEQLGTEEITSMIITHGIGGSPLRFPLHLFYGTNSFGDGSALNRVVQRMTAGKSTYPWAGNLLALKFSGSRRQGYTDATYNDVAPLIASFLEKPGSS